MLSTMLLTAMLLANHNEASAARNHALDVKVKLVKTGSKKVRVISEQSNTTLQISLHNEAGEVLYSGSVVNLDSFGKLFDLSALADGNYSITINGQNFVSTQSVHIKNGALSIIDESYTEISKPEVRLITKNVFEVLSSAPVSLTITDAYGNEVYNAANAQNKRYDLSPLVTGEYRFQTSVNDKAFVEIVKVVK